MAIAGGEYAPDERVREEALADEFEVSRGPVREAQRIQEKDSVVRILPNRGAHVTQLSVKEVSDIFEVRRTLLAR
jgi:DNA-binding GntR family transcriptional regulator